MNPDHKRRLHGIIQVLGLSLIFLFILYGKLILSLNTVFFSTSGDGIQSYFNSTYLVKYDRQLLYSHSMNYPYGELSFYTQGQPFFMAPVKFISDHVVDISPFITGIINFLMLSSIILAALFLFLLFFDIGILPKYGAIIATGLAFLSPQLARMGGHFTLAFSWAIPALLWLLLKYNTTGKMRYCIYSGIALFVLLTGHVYFAAFWFTILAAYLVSELLKKHKPTGRLILMFIYQFILPVALFYFITSFYNHLAPDRPSKPYGFLTYKATPETVFLPLTLDYGKVLFRVFPMRDYEWEGVSYIGLTAVAGFLVITASILMKLFRRKWSEIMAVTGNRFLDTVFWASVVLLAYSFGIPFIFGLESLVDYIGPLKQLRGIGRFAWLFFYGINIAVFYILWHWQLKRETRKWLFWLAIAVLFTDVFFYNKDRQNNLNYAYPEWSDHRNELPENSWVKNIQPSGYQAVIPLPFFHMGSDNFNIPIRCNMLANSYLVSQKTGIPVMAIYISRASVSQSVKDMAVALEPYRPYEILNDIKDNRPFLLIVAHCNELTGDETNLVKSAVALDSNNQFTLYRLDKDSLAALPGKQARSVSHLVTAMKSDTDSVRNQRIHLTFDKQKMQGYIGSGLAIQGRSFITFTDTAFNTASENIPFEVSFWLSPINRDQVPKATLLIEFYDEEGNLYNYIKVMCGDHIKTFDRDWGLIELPFTYRKSGDRIKISFYNDVIRHNRTYIADEFLLRPASCNVSGFNQRVVFMNNRYFPVNEK